MNRDIFYKAINKKEFDEKIALLAKETLDKRTNICVETTSDAGKNWDESLSTFEDITREATEILVEKIKERHEHIIRMTKVVKSLLGSGNNGYRNI